MCGFGERDVEPVQVGEAPLVAVRRVVTQHDLVALAVLLPVHRVVLGQRAAHEDDRGGVPDDFFHRTVEAVGLVGEELCSLIGKIGKEQEGVR